MAHYRKGANAERELIHVLFNKGFSVIRAAGSGKTALPAPDIIALKPGRQLAFECKAWAASHLAIPIEQMQELVGWGKRAGVTTYVAWKIPRKGWFFLRPGQLHKTEKFYLVSKKDTLRRAINLGVIVGEQKQIKLSKG